MNKTKIEWTDYTWNAVTGCLHGCKYCYARKIANRFAGSAAFPEGFKPRFIPDRLDEPYKLKGEKKIFVCSMADLFGDWVPYDWIEAVIDMAWWNPQHTFQFLTKNPKRLRDFNWPENCWVGVTAETNALAEQRVAELLKCNARVRFLSAEPIQEVITTPILREIDWLIVGWVSGQGEKSKNPDYEMIDSVINAGAWHGIPVFEKPNTLRDGPKEFPS